MSKITDYITVKEYAKLHNVSVGAVQQKILRGVLPYKKIGEGFRSINLIKANEPWINHKPGVKKGSRRKHTI